MPCRWRAPTLATVVIANPCEAIHLQPPVPGLAIRYSTRCASEYARGRGEGDKERPSAVVLVTANTAGEKMVAVLPITHSPPADTLLAEEILQTVKRRLSQRGKLNDP